MASKKFLKSDKNSEYKFEIWTFSDEVIGNIRTAFFQQ